MEDLSSFHLNISYIIAINYFLLQPYPLLISRILFFYAFDENNMNDEYAIIVILIKKQKNNYSKEINYVKKIMKIFYLTYKTREELAKEYVKKSE